MKTKELLDDLKQKNIFGNYCDLVYTIEYQKQRLLYMHFLLFLPPEKQFCNADQIDKVVSVEFPITTDDPDSTLMNVVALMMVHGPCGELNPKAKCMTLDSVTNRKKFLQRISKAISTKDCNL